jgi:hypothetical protein
MYLIDERDRVIELKDVPQSSVGAPLPIVLSDESTIVVGYIIQDSSRAWNGTALRTLDTHRPGESQALVEFELYQSYMFGAPNDEAFSSHPLAARGLHPYAAFRIDDSSWVRQLERMNSVHPNHNPNKFQELKHFVFAFHDSTFECVAKDFRISEYEGTLESLLPIMLSRLTRAYGI